MNTNNYVLIERHFIPRDVYTQLNESNINFNEIEKIEFNFSNNPIVSSKFMSSNVAQFTILIKSD